ncbi:MAG: DUF58 domain-containing protein [Lachnospiraceae bacterium]|nr:DUF58 domain-containing protein [Lachnospiraceae bacterium]
MKITRIIYAILIIEIIVLNILFLRIWPAWLFFAIVGVLYYLFFRVYVLSGEVETVITTGTSYLHKGVPGMVMIFLKNKTIIPLSNVHCEVGYKGTEYRYTDWKKQKFDIAGNDQVKIEVDVDTSHVGVVESGIRKMECFDDLGFFKKKYKKNTAYYKAVILPVYDENKAYYQEETEDIGSEDNDRVGSTDESDEVLEVREYAPGDKINHIHWKLTSKYDKPYVRVMGSMTGMRDYLLVDVNVSERDKMDRVYECVMAALYNKVLDGKKVTLCYPANGEVMREEVEEFSQIEPSMARFIEAGRYNFADLKQKFAALDMNGCNIYELKLMDDDKVWLKQVR